MTSKLSFTVSTLILSTSLVAAGPGKLARPWSVTLGPYHPMFSYSGVSKKMGVVLGLSYNWAASETLLMNVESRGSLNQVSDNSGSYDLEVSTFTVGILTRPKKEKDISFGAHLGWSKGRVTSGNVVWLESNTKFAWALSATSNLSKTTFLTTRYQGSSLKGLRGLSTEFGYKF